MNKNCCWFNDLKSVKTRFHVKFLNKITVSLSSRTPCMMLTILVLFQWNFVIVCSCMFLYKIQCILLLFYIQYNGNLIHAPSSFWQDNNLLCLLLLFITKRRRIAGRRCSLTRSFLIKSFKVAFFLITFLWCHLWKWFPMWYF